MQDTTSDSLQYYQRHAARYFQETANLDLSSERARFVSRLPEGASILDAGCGSGRDAKAFAEDGFAVTAIDASLEMVSLARLFTGLDVQQMDMRELAYEDAFDGVWACGSLVHLNESDFERVLWRLARALKAHGWLFLTLKAGPAYVDGHGRHFVGHTSAKVLQILENLGLQLQEFWTNPSRRGTDTWRNFLLQA